MQDIGFTTALSRRGARFARTGRSTALAASDTPPDKDDAADSQSIENESLVQGLTWADTVDLRPSGS